MRRPIPFMVWGLVSLLLILWPSWADARPGDEYTISIITMSPGDPVFFKFGHNAILVHDARRGTHEVYNWGTFSFHEPGLVTKFLRGRLSYWVSVQSLRGTLRHYDAENRWIIEQELNLTTSQKRQMVGMVRKNALPENRYYRYHYYRDNCSTRVRDVVDTVVDGRLRAVSTGSAKMTFRGQTSRLVADTWWAYVFLNLAMGSYIDEPIAEWDEMFVPGKVREVLGRAKNLDDAGREVPLVKSERKLVTATRAAPLESPPNRTIPLMLLGALLGGLLAVLGYRALVPPSGVPGVPRRRRVLFGLLLGGLTTLTGFLGLLFLFFWTLTDHEVAYHNENLLQTSPITAALPVVAVGIMLGRGWARGALRWISYVVCGMSVLGLLLKVIPWFDQVNGEMIAMLLPVWVGLTAASVWSDRTPSKTRLEAAKGETRAEADGSEANAAETVEGEGEAGRDSDESPRS